MKKQAAAKSKSVSVAQATGSTGSAAARTKAASAKLTHSSRWTFLTNHTHVLILLAQNEQMVLREVAAAIGITERAVQRIITDLEEGGFIERHKVGRQNHYRILRGQSLRHPIESHRKIGDILDLICQLPQQSS